MENVYKSISTEIITKGENQEFGLFTYSHLENIRRDVENRLLDFRLQLTKVGASTKVFIDLENEDKPFFWCNFSDNTPSDLKEKITKKIKGIMFNIS